MPDDKQPWVDDVEIENVNVKWAFSHFDGRADTFNDPGEYNFTAIIPEKDAIELEKIGWAIREREGYEEGDPPEFLLKIKISDKFGIPKSFLIKGNRKFRVDRIEDFGDIRRDTCEQLDVIITPSRWVNGPNSGITAYVKELYATVKQNRFDERYSDYEDA